MSKPKVVAFVGPTASGKTALSIEIAKAYGGEVISADSRQVYRGLDIGSGKVTVAEMQGIPHHVLDIIDPTEVYTGSDFVRDATAALTDITARGKLPIIAGGTFFYIELLRGTMQAAPVPPNPELRMELEALTTDKLVARLTTVDTKRASTIDQDNRRRLIRALEIVAVLGAVPSSIPHESPYEWLLIGLNVPKAELHQNIHTRLHERLKQGMVEEVAGLLASGVPPERLLDFGLEYRYLTLYLQGKISYEEMEREIEFKSRQFAKRQLTWLKKDTRIEWYPPQNRQAILRRVATFLTPPFAE